MNNGIITRFIIVKILKKIRESTINIDKSFEVITEKYSISIKDKNYIYNVVITTIRNINTVEQIINKFNVKVNKKDISYYFIISAICQIFFLKQRDYAVTHSTCEALKKFNSKNKINFVNGLLRNLCRNKQSIKLSDLNISHHPRWFKKTVKDITSKKRKSIYNSVIKKPNIGIVFKNQKDINLIKEKCIITSKTSISINTINKIENLKGYKEGLWWVQDFAATIPAKLIKNLKNQKILDMCAAPGGKTFQLLNIGADVISCDVSERRMRILELNAKRLKLIRKYLTQLVTLIIQIFGIEAYL